MRFDEQTIGCSRRVNESSFLRNSRLSDAGSVSRMLQLITQRTRSDLEPWSAKRNEFADNFRDQHSGDAVEAA